MSLDLFDLRQNTQYCVKHFIYQLFWTQACLGGMCTNRTQVPCKVQSLPNPTTRKGWLHHWGLRPLLFSNGDLGSFTSHKNKSVKVLRDGTHGFSSLSEKTRKSKHMQMSSQRQHFGLQFGLKIRRGRGPSPGSTTGIELHFVLLTTFLTTSLPSHLTASF